MSDKYEKNDFWDNIEVSYPQYPTVRHRKRFILKMFKKFCRVKENFFVFDYGCGTGEIIQAVKENFTLNDEQIGGSDMSEKAIKFCRQKNNSPFFFQELYPSLKKKCDVIICSEVIEHAIDYPLILKWIKENLKSGGTLLLSTQGGKMHKIDEYSGHVHTFRINDLVKQINNMGFEAVYARQWGFPFFTLQKKLIDFNFDKIKNSYLEGNPSKIKLCFFQIVYLLYFTEDLINHGPQLYICAVKK